MMVGGIGINQCVFNLKSSSLLAVVIVQFNPISYTVTEGGSTQLIIQKIGKTEHPVTISVSTQEGTASSKFKVDI